jgi:membrane-associated phospholipid phosphatase
MESLRHPALTVLMTGFTLLGDNLFYVLVITLVYWTRDREEAYKLMRIVVLSALLNAVIKELIGAPRPFQTAETGVTGLWLWTAGGSAMPSGHTQAAAAFWSYISVHFRKKGVAILALGLTLLIAFSRLYLGVHWPLDVAVGAGLGACIGLSGHYLLKHFSRWLWFATVFLALYGIFILHDHTALKLSVVLFGAASGDALLMKSKLADSKKITPDPARIKPPGFPSLHLTLEILIGLLLVGGIKIGFDALFKGIGINAETASAITYFSVGLAITYGVPRFILSRGVDR